MHTAGRTCVTFAARADSCTGTALVSRLLEQSSSVRRASGAKSDGIDPVSLLFLKFRLDSAVS